MLAGGIGRAVVGEGLGYDDVDPDDEGGGSAGDAGGAVDVDDVGGGRGRDDALVDEAV